MQFFCVQRKKRKEIKKCETKVRLKVFFEVRSLVVKFFSVPVGYQQMKGRILCDLASRVLGFAVNFVKEPLGDTQLSALIDERVDFLKVLVGNLLDYLEFWVNFFYLWGTLLDGEGQGSSARWQDALFRQRLHVDIMKGWDFSRWDHLSSIW